MKNQTTGQLMTHEEAVQTVWVMGLPCTVRVIATYPVVCGNKNRKRYRFLLPHPNASRQARVNKRQIVPTVLFNRPSDTLRFSCLPRAVHIFPPHIQGISPEERRTSTLHPPIAFSPARISSRSLNGTVSHPPGLFLCWPGCGESA